MHTQVSTTAGTDSNDTSSDTFLWHRGSPLNCDTLRRCGVLSARRVVVLGDTDESIGALAPTAKPTRRRPTRHANTRIQLPLTAVSAVFGSTRVPAVQSIRDDSVKE
ncbi:MAG: hypothetical protein MHM6MM_007805 [Cercozoa sp. M6MM]